MKRTPMKVGISKKPPKCKNCKQPFERSRPGQKVCGADCAGALAVSQRAKQERIERKRKEALERRDVALRKEAMKPLAKWIAEAQTAFNAFIRARDAGKPCICCGKHTTTQYSSGGIWDAGHYRSRGSAGHLRFHEDNCHAQLKQCNRFGSGRAVDYRLGLIARIGLERVEALEADNTIHKWTIEEVKQIKATYKSKLKELRES